jgi:hypothetical protein
VGRVEDRMHGKREKRGRGEKEENEVEEGREGRGMEEENREMVGKIRGWGICAQKVRGR